MSFEGGRKNTETNAEKQLTTEQYIFALNTVGVSPEEYAGYKYTLVQEGYGGFDQVLNEPRAVDLILPSAKHYAARGATEYGRFMSLWKDNGFDRAKIDTEPEIREIILRELLSWITSPATMMAYARDWETNNPSISQYKIMQDPEILEAIRAEVEFARAEDERRVAQYRVQAGDSHKHFDALAEMWQSEAGINVRNL